VTLFWVFDLISRFKVEASACYCYLLSSVFLKRWTKETCLRVFLKAWFNSDRGRKKIALFVCIRICLPVRGCWICNIVGWLIEKRKREKERDTERRKKSEGYWDFAGNSVPERQKIEVFHCGGDLHFQFSVKGKIAIPTISLSLFFFSFCFLLHLGGCLCFSGLGEKLKSPSSLPSLYSPSLSSIDHQNHDF